MAQNYKIENTLKNVPFYNEEIKYLKKEQSFTRITIFLKKIK